MQSKKHKIGVIYDTSYLAANGPSIKSFILSRQFLVPEKPGLFSALTSLVKGTKEGSPRGVTRPAESLFDIYQVIPNEVIRELEYEMPAANKECPALAAILKEEATRIDLSMDSFVGSVLSQNPAPAEMSAKMANALQRKVDEQLLGYAARLVAYGTRERYDLAVVATDDGNILRQIGALSQSGKAVFGITTAQLSQSRTLQDKLSDLASLGRSHKVSAVN
jgi:hypothetical protein